MLRLGLCLSLSALLFIAVMSAHSQPPNDPISRAGEMIGDAAAQEFLSVRELTRYQRIGVVVRAGEGAEAAARAMRAVLVTEGREIPPIADARIAVEAVGVAWASGSSMSARQIAQIMDRLDVQGLVAVRVVPVREGDTITQLRANVELSDPVAEGRPWSVDIEVDVPRSQVRESYWQQNPKIVWGAIIAAVVIWILSAAMRRRRR